MKDLPEKPALTDIHLDIMLTPAEEMVMIGAMVWLKQHIDINPKDIASLTTKISDVFIAHHSKNIEKSKRDAELN